VSVVGLQPAQTQMQACQDGLGGSGKREVAFCGAGRFKLGMASCQKSRGGGGWARVPHQSAAADLLWRGFTAGQGVLL